MAEFWRFGLGLVGVSHAPSLAVLLCVGGLSGVARPIGLGVTTDSGPKATLIEFPRREDSLEVAYALKLRDLKSDVERVMRSPIKASFLVLVDAADLDQCREVLPLILDAMLPRRADDGAGNCYFCGYSLMGTSSYFENCPECGKSLLSVEARIAARDGKR